MALRPFGLGVRWRRANPDFRDDPGWGEQEHKFGFGDRSLFRASVFDALNPACLGR